MHNLPTPESTGRSFRAAADNQIFCVARTIPYTPESIQSSRERKTTLHGEDEVFMWLAMDVRHNAPSQQPGLAGNLLKYLLKIWVLR